MEFKEFQQETPNPYCVNAEVHSSRVVVNFYVYEGDNYTADLEPWLVGHIKWDGCSNWTFTHPNYPLHFCSPQRVENFNKFLLELYQWAAELLPEYKENILFKD